MFIVQRLRYNKLQDVYVHCLFEVMIVSLKKDKLTNVTNVDNMST